MVRKPAAISFHLGAWLIARGRTASELSQATGINEGYISQLISGKKKNPSIDKRAAIAKFLGIPIGSLYSKPPSPDAMAKLTAAHIEALAVLMEQYGIGEAPWGDKGPKSH